VCAVVVLLERERYLCSPFGLQFNLRKGVYVDVGAYHPILGSNTLLLYKEGWRDINIDLAAERVASFNRYRPNDYNVVACVSDETATVEIAHYEISATDRIVLAGDTEKLSTAGFKPIRFSHASTTTLTEIIKGSPFRLDASWCMKAHRLLECESSTSTNRTLEIFAKQDEAPDSRGTNSDLFYADLPSA
jgi:hypothetical protein